MTQTISNYSPFQIIIRNFINKYKKRQKMVWNSHCNRLQKIYKPYETLHLLLNPNPNNILIDIETKCYNQLLESYYNLSRTNIIIELNYIERLNTIVQKYNQRIYIWLSIINKFENKRLHIDVCSHIITYLVEDRYTKLIFF